MMAMVLFACPLRRSGNHTPLVLPGVPQFFSAVGKSAAPEEMPLLHTKSAGFVGKLGLLFGGVIPPRPEKYGTLAWRYPLSKRKVMYCEGIQSNVTVPS